MNNKTIQCQVKAGTDLTSKNVPVLVSVVVARRLEVAWVLWELLAQSLSVVLVLAVAVALPLLLWSEQLGEEESLEHAESQSGQQSGEETTESSATQQACTCTCRSCRGGQYSPTFSPQGWITWITFTKVL